MNRQVIMSSPVPKPKVFRLPPATSPQQIKHAPVARPNRVWRWGMLLLALALILPAMQKSATTYFARVPSTGATSESDDFVGNLKPAAADAQAALPAEKPSTILLHGQSEGIVGQMAKIPAANEPIIETKAASEVDNNAAHELLSIISKY